MTHLLYTTYQKNLEQQEEIFMITNSIEAGLIHFEDKRAKYINNQFVCFLRNTLPKDISYHFLQKDQLNKSQTQNTGNKLNETITAFLKLKIFRIYQTP